MSGLHITGLGEELTSLSTLPWHLPLEQWPEDAELAQKRGISRHIVRLVRPTDHEDGEIYAIKETVDEFAKREYSLLRELTLRNAPSVDAIAIVDGRVNPEGEALPPALVTRFLPYSLPYRVILSGVMTPHEITNMANALALLLVRMHLLGFWWGDCSLSNTLFRRDADQFAAYLVDAETGEFHVALSNGQREHDLEIAEFNVAAELEDLACAGVLHPGMDPIRSAQGLIKRYRRLWQVLKEPQILDPNDRHAIERAMRSVQDLGFAVEEVDVVLNGEHGMLTFQPKLVAAGYHSGKLFELMGITTEELQAKRLLASFERFRSRESKNGFTTSELAKRWFNEVYQPVVDRVPPELEGRVEPAQIFHEVLEHRWYLGERAGRDLGIDFATKDYIEKILPYRMDSGVVVNQD